MQTVANGLMYLLVVMMGGIIIGIALSPIYFAYRKRHEIWQFIYSKTPDKYRILLRAKLCYRRINKKIRQLKREQDFQVILKKIDRIVASDLVELLKNKTILTESRNESKAALNFWKEHKKEDQSEIVLRQKEFSTALADIDRKIDQILLLLDRLSLNLSKLLVEGLPKLENIQELILATGTEITLLLESQEEVTRLEKKFNLVSPAPVQELHAVDRNRVPTRDKAATMV